MKLSFYGADQCVTGSCHCLEVNGKHILVDCGLQQGRDEIDNTALPFHPGSIDVVLVTHAHIDHSGRIPMLIKNGFQGKIITTRLTADLLDIMLQDSAHIQEQDAEYQNRKNKRAGRPEVEPIYTVADALRVREFIQTCEYGQDIPVVEGVTAQFIDAGHLLGSASIKLTCHEGDETRTVVFSGDIGNVDQPIIRDPQFFDSADYVLTESTYGDRLHGPRPDYVNELAKILQRTFDRGGNVVIPSVYKDCIVIPQGATVQMQDKTIAYKVVDGKAVSTLISVAGINDGREYVVLDGLKAGDEIISEGAGLIREGTVVK